MWEEVEWLGIAPDSNPNQYYTPSKFPIKVTQVRGK